MNYTGVGMAALPRQTSVTSHITTSRPSKALTRRLEGLRLVRLGTWDRLQNRGFRVREAQAILQLPQHRVSDSALPTRYLLPRDGGF